METAFFLIKKNPINKEAFSSTIFADNGDDTELAVFRKRCEELLCFWAEFEALILVERDEGDGESGRIF